MALQAQEFLEFARDRCDGGSEVEFRDCANRAYYAAFHACLETAQPLPESNPTSGLHSRLIAALKERPDTRAIALMLGRARDFQLEADYNLDSTFTQQQARQALELAGLILKQITAIGR